MVLLIWIGKEKKIKMNLALRIPLTLTIIVVVTGIIAFIKISTKSGAFPTSSFIIWLVVSVILIGITIWSFLRNKKK
jgi:heme/copper-type cytochrome/quinol oxidase subunit 4